jgi:hypothetical protein
MRCSLLLKETVDDVDQRVASEKAGNQQHCIEQQLRAQAFHGAARRRAAGRQQLGREAG